MAPRVKKARRSAPPSDSRKLVIPPVPVKFATNYEEEYEPYAIQGCRLNIYAGHVQYYVKWAGYPFNENTWESAENLKGCKIFTPQWQKVGKMVEKNFKSQIQRIHEETEEAYQNVLEISKPYN